MYCNQCGTQLPEDASFCLNCGKAIKTSKDQAPKSAPNNKNRLSKRTIVVIVIAALAACALIAIVAFAITSKESKYGYDIHRVIYNGTDVGEIFLNASSEDVGLYIDKDASCSQEAFGQMGAGVILACDPSTDLDKAKEIFNSALDKPKSNDAAWNNDVSYDVYISDARYILHVRDIPETPEEQSN